MWKISLLERKIAPTCKTCNTLCEGKEPSIIKIWHRFASTPRFRTWEENDPISCPFTMMLNLTTSRRFVSYRFSQTNNPNYDNRFFRRNLSTKKVRSSSLSHCFFLLVFSSRFFLRKQISIFIWNIKVHLHHTCKDFLSR